MNTWQPMSTAPKDGTKILIVYMNASDPEIMCVSWNLFKQAWDIDYSNYIPEEKAIHWMPAPALPPKEKERELSLGELTRKFNELEARFNRFRLFVKRFIS